MRKTGFHLTLFLFRLIKLPQIIQKENIIQNRIMKKGRGPLSDIYIVTGHHLDNKQLLMTEILSIGQDTVVLSQ